MEKKLKEEREAREKAENRVVETEKQCSMLDVDLKQSQQKLEHLTENKERMEDEVRHSTNFNFILLLKEKLFQVVTGEILSVFETDDLNEVCIHCYTVIPELRIFISDSY